MRRLTAVAASLLVFLAACGSDSPSDPGGGTTLVNGTFGASVNGSAYVPVVVAIVSSGGFVAMASSNAAGGGLGWVFYATGPGGPIAIAQTAGNSASYSEGSSSWSAGYGTGGSGSVTFTTLTSSRAAGHFTLELVANAGTGATGTRTISGNFDITISS